MRITDVDVSISLSGQSGQAGAWFPLLYVGGTEAEASYKEYSSLQEVAVDHKEDTDAYKVASLLFMQGEEYAPSKIAICTGVETVMTGLADYMDKDWRQLILVNKEFDKTVSTAIEATEKMYFTHFKSQTEATTAKITDYDRTAGIVYTHEDVINPEAAIIGRMAGLAAGEGTYHAKPVVGVTADVFTQAELDAIHTAGCFAYVQKNGRVATSNGITGSGEWIDVIESKDYVVQNVRYDVQEVFLNNNKVTYDYRGIAQLENAVRNVLQKAFNNGIIAADDNGAPLYKVNTVPRSETTAEDRATRAYNYLTFEFELAGAIHKAKITGVVTA